MILSPTQTNLFSFNTLGNFNFPSVNSPTNYGGFNAPVDYEQDEIKTSQAPDAQKANFYTCYMYGVGCDNVQTPGAKPFGEWVTDGLIPDVASALKNYALIIAACAFIILGVYLMTRSTTEGQAILKAVTKV